jgi:hypothetical protein
MLDESTQVSLENTYRMQDAIKYQREQYEAFHALLDLVAPVNKSEAITQIVKLEFAHFRVQEFKHTIYQNGSTESADYQLEVLHREWMKLAGLTA